MFNNSRWATFEVRGLRQVLTLVDDVQNAAIWKLALESFGVFRCVVKTADDPVVRGMSPRDMAAYSAICLLGVARPSAELWRVLNAYVREGGGLAIVPGGNEMVKGAYELDEARKLMPGELVGVIPSETDAGSIWDAKTYSHPVMAAFKDWKIKDDVDFGCFKPGNVEIELQLLDGQVLEFNSQDVGVPPCLLCQPVVGNDVRSLLLRAEVLKADRRHLREAEELRCVDAAVPRDNCSIRINQHWIRESKFSNAGGDLMNLLLGVRPRITWPRV
jgi:hypothetical protein